ncbi:Rossmann-like domain-containing protein [Halobaculum marinum]|uniref:Rossmann-like domain-containing protein n=1 Tax=Halobaculum marinum TaxID=3031996 RepID=A0ABD5WXN0_9EURY|nr:DUF364 domain-containing protein [Halobaculum sp. DT55]
MSDAVVRAVVDALRERGAFDGVAVDHVTVGDAAVFVELRGDGDERNGTDWNEADRNETNRNGADVPRAGLAHRPPGPAPAVEGVDIETLVAWALGEAPTDGDAAVARAVGVATLNALSAPFVDWRDGDPMERLSADVETIATVGLFRPAFRKFDAVDVRVVERDPVDVAEVETPPGVTVSVVPPADTAVAMAGADVVFVTGSTLVYGGLGEALAAAPAEATVVVVGASASLLPDPLFAAGADVVAGAAVDDPVRVRAAVEAGACGTDLHDAGVRKGYVAAAPTAGIDLTPAGHRAGDDHDDHDDHIDRDDRDGGAVADTTDTPDP